VRPAAETTAVVVAEEPVFHTMIVYTIIVQSEAFSQALAGAELAAIPRVTIGNSFYGTSQSSKPYRLTPITFGEVQAESSLRVRT